MFVLTVQVRSLGETVRLDARTKLLNPKWYEGMLNSGYEGVREIQKRLTNTVGWSAHQTLTGNHACKARLLLQNVQLSENRLPGLVLHDLFVGWSLTDIYCMGTCQQLTHRFPNF